MVAEKVLKHLGENNDRDGQDQRDPEWSLEHRLTMPGVSSMPISVTRMLHMVCMLL
jgi:hypothetical protein